MSTIVAKVGTSSLTDDVGVIDTAAIEKLCGEVAQLRVDGHDVVVVSSGAVSAGVAALGLKERPTDTPTLQALAAAGQSRLMRTYDDILATHGLVPAQVLLVPHDFIERRQYLHARQTLTRLLELGAVPIVNENDALADDEIRFGDNDRLAALVAHLVNADLLVLLTDTPGVLTADPRLDANASLIEEVVGIDRAFEEQMGGAGSQRGSGGMASKVAAAAHRVVVGCAGRDRRGRSTWRAARCRRGRRGRGHGGAPARAPPAGAQAAGSRSRWRPRAWSRSTREHVAALVDGNRSLLPGGVVGVKGDFLADDAIEVAGPGGVVFAKGLSRIDAHDLSQVMGRRTSELPEGWPHEVVHRDDLVVLPG